MLISSIINEIVIEVGGDVDDSDFATTMLTFFKSGFRRIPVLIKDRTFAAVGSLALVAGASTADTSLLTGFIKERFVWYVGDDASRIPIYKPPSRPYFHLVIQPNAVGKPSVYDIYGTTFQVDKKADTLITVGFDYFKAVSAITASDTFIGNEQMIEAVKDFAKEIYYRDYEEDKQKADDHRDNGLVLVKMLEEEYEIQEFGGYVEEKN